MRRSTRLDPQIAADLDALDAALRDEHDADPALVAFAGDVRSARPEIDASFLAQLDARAAAGFGAEDRRARGRFTIPRLYAIPAFGTAVAAAIVVVVVAGSGGGSGHPGGTRNVLLSQPLEHSPGTVGSAGSASSADGAGTALPPAAAVAPSTATAAPERKTAAPAEAAAPLPGATTGARKVERSTDLTLSTSASGLQDVSDGVVRVTQALGGIVQSSRIDRATGGGTATFSLRVPSTRLSAALKDLARLAHITSMSQSTDDITREYSSAATLLRDAQRERAALLRALAHTSTAHDVASLHARLADNRAAITADRAQVASVSQRADFARLSVTVEGHGRAAAPAKHHHSGAFGPGAALRSAGRVLGAVAGALLVGAAAAAPVALLLGLAWFAARAARRRRREQALDATV